jgi:hypothetical protein
MASDFLLPMSYIVGNETLKLEEFEEHFLLKRLICDKGENVFPNR